MSKEASGSYEEILKDVMGLFDLRDAFSSPLSFAGEDDGGDDGDDGSDDTDGTEEDDSSTDDGDDDGSASGSDKDIKDPEKKRLSEEAAAARVKAKQERKLREAAEKELRDLKDAAKPEEERKNARLQELEEMVPKFQQMAVENALFRAGAFDRFVDPEAALKFLDLSEFEVEDGEVDADAVTAKVDDLLKRKPYLAKTSSDDDDDDTSSTSGPSLNRRRNGDKSKNGYEELAKKFPALRR
jgi:hypothetical protein